MNTRRKLPILGLWLVSTFLGVSHPIAAQTDDPISIRVESNLVLVHTEVYVEDWRHFGQAYRDCRKANMSVFYALPFSMPFTPKDCDQNIVMEDLEPAAFHVFEDGEERKVQSARFEAQAFVSVRDNQTFHGEWSNTPRGKWSTLDVKGWETAPAHYFYRLAYVPAKPEEGKCHKIKVKVDRRHADVYASDQYCYTTNLATDPLNRTKLGEQMETDSVSHKRASIPVSVQVGFVYTSVQMARVDIAIQFPWNLAHHFVRAFVPGGTSLQASIGVLGMVLKKDGALATRFTDLACCDSGGQQWGGLLALLISQSGILPSRYETQLDLPAGADYDLLVVLSDGENFGRVDVPLRIDSYDGKQLAISSVVLSNRFRDAKVAAEEAAAVNLAPAYVPLVSKGFQFTPAAYTRFKSTDHLTSYFEVYKPLVTEQPATQVQAHVKIVDAQTGQTRFQFAPIDATSFERRGTTTLAVAGDLPLSQLPKGDYLVEAQATDSAGRTTPMRTATFTIE
jgi:hypothetical protein